MQVLPYRYQGTRSATQYCQQPAVDYEVGLAAHPSIVLTAVTAAAAGQPAAAAAPPPPPLVKCWSATLEPSRAQFVKAWPASARLGYADHIGSKAPQTACQ